ncbi:hypothetical protein [Martelella soudanensis]|uniref:hypothetical protein n=1 Tax=unclassified Martelella TaxID=2629616 RepID=UPI001FEE32DD|nr:MULTISPECIES: hypothetical protein [unclassified Martelella]
MVGIIILALVGVLLIGVFYLYLHALPERMAHSSNAFQLQLVGVLALLSLFTHNNIFWIAALLIVAVRIPDFITPVNSIAHSLHRIAQSRDLSEAEVPQSPATVQPEATPTEEAALTEEAAPTEETPPGPPKKEGDGHA